MSNQKIEKELTVSVYCGRLIMVYHNRLFAWALAC